jgi:tetratricopeptide (TPR) repeat protein
MFELKRLSPAAVPAALEKAHRYRLLNEPTDAESICRDVLAVDPENQEALVTLVLALSDQLEERMAAAYDQARVALSQLRDEYKRHYYAGILCERRAKAQQRRGGPRAGHTVYDWFRQAMDHYESAAAMRPAANDDALLRWNACARVLNAHPDLAPEAEEAFRPWLE